MLFTLISINKMDTWMIKDILSYDDIDIDTILVLNNVSKSVSVDADILTRDELNIYVSGSLRFAKYYVQKEKLLDDSRTDSFIELMRKMSLCRGNEHIVLWMLGSMIQQKPALKYELYLVFLNACTLGWFSVVECMYNIGACSDRRGLEKACTYGHVSIVKKLLTLADAHTDWVQLVHNASYRGNEEIVELLIKEMKKRNIKCDYSQL
jgi:hypothetical protein